MKSDVIFIKIRNLPGILMLSEVKSNMGPKSVDKEQCGGVKRGGGGDRSPDLIS